MYGTIARLHPMAGRESELEGLMEGWQRDRGDSVRGLVASYLYRPDRNPYDRPTLFLVAVFTDRESYRANADDPAQDAWYRKLRATLDDDPEWMDGTFESAARTAGAVA